MYKQITILHIFTHTYCSTPVLFSLFPFMFIRKLERQDLLDRNDEKLHFKQNNYRIPYLIDLSSIATGTVSLGSRIGRSYQGGDVS